MSAVSSIRSIVERSSSIWERLDGGFIPAEERAEVVAFHHQTWLDSTASGDSDLFAKRLALDGVPPDLVARGLGAVHLPAECTLPSWGVTLERLIAAAHYDEAARSDVPFSEVLQPLVRDASLTLRAQVADAVDLMTPEAFQQLQRTLTRQLSALFMPAIASEMALARYLNQLHGDSPEQRHQYFLETRLGNAGALLQFLSGYPALARLLAVRVEQWVEATAEFIVRARDDWDDIQRVLGAGRALGRIAWVGDSLSDSHRRARTVKAVRFESGLAVVYKPRSLGVDVGFANFIRWLNDQGLSVPLRACTVIDQTTHGWVEHVTREPCTGPAGVSDYYRRSGMLVGVVYMLGGSDMHFENVIASGDDPVLVDMEMVLGLPNPVAATDGSELADAIAERTQLESVLNTGLLPRWMFIAQDRPGVDGGGLSAEAGQTGPVARTTWANVMSDEIESGVAYPRLGESRNQPVLSGEPTPPQAHIGDIVSGFEELYRVLLRERDGLRANPHLAALCRQAIRYLNRPTVEYSLILERSLDVDSLRDARHRSIRIDLLARRLLNQTRPQVWPLLGAEREALERLDIPYFEARGDSRSLLVGDGRTIPAFFARTAEEALHDRVARLSERDLREQVGWLRASLARRQSVQHGDDDETVWTEAARLDDEVLRSVAAEIGHRLIRQAIRGADATTTWLGVEFVPSAGQHNVQVMSVGEYGGLAGMALLFASLERFIPGAAFGDQALMIVNTLRCRRLATRRDLLVNLWGVGGLTGVVSVAHALGWSANLLDAAPVMREAEAWADMIGADAIDRCRKPDVLNGLAGAIPSLLRLHTWRGDDRLLAHAVRCAKRLLDLDSPMGEPESGFSHGLAGIGYALVQLAKVTGQEEFVEAGSRAFAKGRQAPASLRTRWCHGSPGAALAKIGSLPILDGMEVRADIAEGLEAAAGYGVRGTDSLCCGNCGRIDILMTAGRRLADARCADAALAGMSGVVGRFNALGTFGLRSADVGQEPVGLFQGLAGIAYTCLRLADHDNVLPSLLLLE